MLCFYSWFSTTACSSLNISNFFKNIYMKRNVCVKDRDVEYNLVERRVDSINRMNKTFDEPDDDVHPSNGGGCRRCGTAKEGMVERRKGRMKKRHIEKKGGSESGRG